MLMLIYSWMTNSFYKRSLTTQYSQSTEAQAIRGTAL